MTDQDARRETEILRWIDDWLFSPIDPEIGKEEFRKDAAGSLADLLSRLRAMSDASDLDIVTAIRKRINQGADWVFNYTEAIALIADVRRAAVEQCAQAAEAATLPAHFMWGHDAMEQFDFGKERAALAIRALAPTTKEPQG